MNKNKISKKYYGVEGGLFSTITKADVGDSFAKLQEKGVNLLGWADPFFPDYMIPEHIEQATKEAINSGIGEHYTLPIGNPELRREIAKKLSEYNNMNVDFRRNIIVTPGSDSGLYYAMSIFLDEGDEVLIPSPSYPNNFLNPQLMGAKAIPVELKEENGYQIEIDKFEEKLTDKTKIVLLTNPNNPTGTIFTRKSLVSLSKFIIDNDLICVVDQAFEDIIYDNLEFVSIASLPGMWERCVSVFSISKGMGLSGFRVGYIVANDVFMDVLHGGAVSVIGATNSAAQIGAIAGLKNRKFIKTYKEIFDSRRQIIYEIVNSAKGVSMSMPQSAFLAWINVSKLGKSHDVCQYLIENARVAGNEGIAYGPGGEGHIRIVFGCYKDDQIIYDSFKRLKKAFDCLANQKGIY